jgi:leucine efflux protein
VLGTAVVVLPPGPNSLYVLSVAARRGVREGYRPFRRALVISLS